MAQTVALKAERRAANGKGAARQIRLQGKVPGVVYGHGREPESVAVSLGELEKALIGIAAESTLFDLSVDGKTVKALIREIQRHPVRSRIIHIDFYEIHADEKITLSVPVYLEGAPDGVKNGGGVLDQVLREIEIQVLPADIPERVTADVTALAIGHSLHVRDLKVERATILTDLDATLCTVVPPRAEEVTPVAAEAAAEAAEPELIRKPKEEEEGEGEGEAEAPAKAEKPAKPEKEKKS
ncbi:MAG: 50S ribosomal protein L25/general stress protein Ctc [Gemmatimonadetes bacterium]|nr:50S ribosomal protein L25/general stress protein Ctc [Gemmatimonadota bacterium]